MNLNVLILINLYAFLSLSTVQSFDLAGKPFKKTSTRFHNHCSRKVQNSKGNQFDQRRRIFLPTIASIASQVICFHPQIVSANDGVPRIGRFERLKGANSFIGVWEFESSLGIRSGNLSLLKNGDVELRKSSGDNTAESLVGVGAVPWKYLSPKGSDSLVTLYFTLDEDGEDNVLIFQGTFDANMDEKVMDGTIAVGGANFSSRGINTPENVGYFKAKFKQNT